MEEGAGQPGLESRERRHIHITPGQVLAAGQEVEFIDEKPVAGGREQMQQEFQDSQTGNDAQILHGGMR